ncbi:MAG: alpha/beta hydrolase [Bacteroidales bacterium]
MKNILILTGLFFALSGCISQKISEKEVFNPIKEYELTTDFTFNRNLLQKNDSIEIETWYLTMPNANFNLIYFSGNGSNIRSAIPFFNSLAKQTNLNIFSFNYSGYGLSTGTPSINGIIDDANLAIQHFSQIKNSSVPTILMGYSLGGYVALQMANSEQIDKIVLLSTFTSAEDLEIYLKKEALPKVIKPFIKFDIDKKVYDLNNIVPLTGLAKPILILHGSIDDFIPPSMGKKLFELSQSKHKYFKEIQGADHRTVLKDDYKSSLVASEIIRFIDLPLFSDKK